MDKRKSFPVSIICFLLLSSALIVSVTTIEVVQAESRGPRSDLKLIFYDDAGQAYSALKNGSVDFTLWVLNATMLQDAQNDPNLIVSKMTSLTMYGFDINNNYTIRDYSGVKSPTFEAKFRRAMTCAIDKDYILNRLVSDFGTRIDQPIPTPSSSWMNETHLGDGYPYKYNLTRAGQLLDELGFVDVDYNGWRNYPADWAGAPGADFTEYPLEVYVRNDHVSRLEAGRYLVTQLESLGIKCNKTEIPKDINMRRVVMAERNYHIYTAGWSLSRLPTWLVQLYHGANWNDEDVASNNYVTGRNESNLPNYPQLDRLIEAMCSSATFGDSEIACEDAMGFFVENCISIPLWTAESYIAYRREVHGVLPTNLSLSTWSGGSSEVLSRYTLLSAYKDDAEPLRIATSAPDNLNVLLAWDPAKWFLLSRIYDDLMYFKPYDPMADQPWLANQWETGTWVDGESGETKTKLTFQLRNDSYWVKPVTGEAIGQFTATDCEFSIWYACQAQTNAWKPYSVHHAKVIDDHTLDVYLNEYSLFGLYDFSYPLLPMQIWTNFTQLAELRDEIYVAGTNATVPGYLDLPVQDIGAPVAIASVKAGDLDLVKYTDYIMEEGKVRILKDMPNGTRIAVTYWALGNPDGFYPGDLPWQDIMVGNDAFYITELVPEPGGYMHLKANPNYFASPMTFQKDIAVESVTPQRTMLQHGEAMNITVLAKNEGNATENFRVTLYANASSVGTLYAYNVLPNATNALAFEWNTTAFVPGNYRLKAVAETLLDETHTSDNTCSEGVVTITLPSGTCAQLLPSSIKLTHGIYFVIDVTIVNASNLYGFEVNMTYDPTIISGIRASEGSFLKQEGLTLIFANETNDEKGYIWFAVSLYGTENVAEGNGTLFTVFFSSSMTAVGTSPIVFCDSSLSDKQGEPITHYSFSSAVEVVEIDTEEHLATKNSTEYQVATVSNSTIHSFEYKENESRISLNATGAPDSMSFCNLTIPKELLNGTFAVLVNGAAKYYDTWENETHYILSFTFSCSEVKLEILLTIRGDINGDRKVDLFDAVLVLVAYGSKPGDPDWDPRVDLRKDNRIDIFDAVLVCSQYGKRWQP